MSAVGAIIWKDLVLELRTREVLTSTALFALLVALTFSFALDLRLDVAREVVPGAFWVTLILSALLALNRTLAAEREGATIEGLRMAPVDRGSIFAAKFFVNLLFMLWIALISAVAFSVFFNIGFEWAGLAIAVVLGSIGLSAVGTIFAAMATSTRAREALLPALMLPVTTPVVIAAVRATEFSIEGKGVDQWGIWLSVLIVFDIVFVLLSFITFEFVIEE